MLVSINRVLNSRIAYQEQYVEHKVPSPGKEILILIFI